ncbi:hypothetical protein [Chitinophaga sp. sic0106]|uniref:hypothetical protein n=1 Tax=Chitinophaga sp. sic0106 TaxID=2854785 RepID=UPI001C47FE18|nr:hypothetical protein [Chitinophaga sp. sic0106]MBV7534064.1 hypothetical protein [Chitinophaga sp. sic0106]
MGSNYIHPTAVIGPNVTMGTGNYIGPYCVIGMPAEHRGKWDPANPGDVVIGDNCRITGHVTIDAGMEGYTYIGDNAFIMKHAHVGHDAQIHNDVTISCGAKIGGHTVVEHHATIGLNAVIHQRHHIGAMSMIGMGAVVPLKVEIDEGGVYAGNPARYIRQNIIP